MRKSQENNIEDCSIDLFHLIFSHKNELNDCEIIRFINQNSRGNTFERTKVLDGIIKELPSSIVELLFYSSLLIIIIIFIILILNLEFINDIFPRFIFLIFIILITTSITYFIIQNYLNYKKSLNYDSNKFI